MLKTDFVDQYRSKTPPWGPAGYVVYKRTYARMMSNGKSEEWFQTVERCVNGLMAIRPVMSEMEQMALYDYVFNLKCCFSGRELWQLGTPNIERFGGDSLQNCWAVNVNDPIHPFCFTFNELMLGGGVGFNITPESVFEIPRVKFRPDIKRIESFDCDFIVEDNREGWVKLLGKVLKSCFFTGKRLYYNTSCIREKGKEITSFGGTASGSENLVKGIQQIVTILATRYTEKLRPIDALDMMNIIGQVVIAGNVRRSAELALGSVKDEEFMNAKNWGRHTIPNWRGMSNNSVICNHYEDLTPEFWDGYTGEGEAYGLVNLSACRNYGRIVDGLGYRPDPLIIGANPCVEIGLETDEACNLGEIFLPNIRDLAEFKTAGLLVYKACKIISTLPFIYDSTNAVVKRNRRIGISVTGFTQSNHRYDSEMFSAVYNHIEKTDKEFSQLLGVEESVKLTTVQPSGTKSLLAGVSSGCHLDFAPYYIRRIQMSANDPLVDLCRKHGYYVEPKVELDGSQNLETMVVSFPIKAKGTCANEVDAIGQLETMAWLQRYWADNAVSCTIYYEMHELPAIQQWLRINYEKVKSISFLLKSNHGFQQAPLEEIDEKQYHEMSSQTKPITRIIDDKEYELVETLECAKGGCPIK